MSKLSEQLRCAGIYNNHGLLTAFGGKNDVVVDYTARLPGRLGWCTTNHTTVWALRPVVGLERSAQRQTFERVYNGNRSESLPHAKDWVSATLGHELVPSPFGGYVPKHIVEAAKKMISQKAA